MTITRTTRTMRTRTAILTVSILLAPTSPVFAQRWTATEVLRVTGPQKSATFRGVTGVSVGASRNFYVLDSKPAVLYGFAPDGALKWQADVPTRPNPLFAMMRDTAAMREMAGSMARDMGRDSGAARRADANPRSRAAAGDRAAGGGRARAGARGGRGGRGADAMPGMGRGGNPFDPANMMNNAEKMGVGVMMLVPLANGELAIPDLMGRQTTVYDTTGALVRTDGFFDLMDAPTTWAGLGSNLVGVTRSVAGMLAGLMNGGKDNSGYTVKVMPSQNSRGQDIANIQIPSPMSFDGTTMRMNLQPPMPVLASSGDRLFVGSNERYHISMYDTDGNRIGTIQRTVQRKPLSAADKMRVTREFAQMMDSVPPVVRERIKMQPDMSDSLPAITSIVAGDSVLLVRRGSIVAKEPVPIAANTARWDIIAWDNTYLGYVDLPAGFEVSSMKDGRLYGELTAVGKRPVVVVFALAPPTSTMR